MYAFLYPRPFASLHVRLPLTTNSFVCVCWLQTGHNKIISDKVCYCDCDCSERAHRCHGSSGVSS
jgi:hypothetical protein